MGIFYISIAVTVIVAIGFLLIFLKSVKSGQYDDMYTPSVRMLFEDELVQDKNVKKSFKKKDNFNKQK